MLASVKYNQSIHIFPTKQVLLFSQYRSSHRGMKSKRTPRKCGGRRKGTTNHGVTCCKKKMKKNEKKTIKVRNKQITKCTVWREKGKSKRKAKDGEDWQPGVNPSYPSLQIYCRESRLVTGLCASCSTEQIKGRHN